MLLSKDVRECVLWLVHHGYAPPDICEVFSISDRTLQRWKTHPNLYANPFLRRPQARLLARKPILNADGTHDLATLLADAPHHFLDAVQDWLGVAHDLRLSPPALFDGIRDASRAYRLLLTAAAERDDDARAECMDEIHAHFVAQQLVFVLETGALYRHYGRTCLGSSRTAIHNEGEPYSMIAALSLHGYEAVKVVAGAVDHGQWVDFVTQDLVRVRNVMILSKRDDVTHTLLAASKNEPLSPGQERCGV